MTSPTTYPPARMRDSPLATTWDMPCWEAVCGAHRDCGGVLAQVHPLWLRQPGEPLCYFAQLRDGYVAVRVGDHVEWRWGRHAGARHNRSHAPRRRLVLATFYSADGVPDVEPGQLHGADPSSPGFQDGAGRYPVDVRGVSYGKTVGPLSDQDRLVIWCPDHGHVSHVSLADLIEGPGGVLPSGSVATRDLRSLLLFEMSRVRVPTTA